MCNVIRISPATNTGNSVLRRVGTLLQQGMEQIGIGVDYEIVEFGDLVSQLTQSYDWDRALRAAGRDPQRLWQQHAHALRALGHPLPVQKP